MSVDSVVDSVSVPTAVPVWDAFNKSQCVGLSSAIRAVILAAGKDSTLPMLTGVRVELPESGGIRLVATDRYRLHVAGIDCEPMPDDSAPAALVPAKALKPYVQSLRKAEHVHLALAGGLAVTVRGGDATSHADVPVLMGEYPKVGGLLRTFQEQPDRTHVASFNPAYMADTMDAASYCAERNTPARMTFGRANGPTLVETDPTGPVRFLGVVMPVRTSWADSR